MPSYVIRGRVRVTYASCTRHVRVMYASRNASCTRHVRVARAESHRVMYASCTRHIRVMYTAHDVRVFLGIFFLVFLVFSVFLEDCGSFLPKKKFFSLMTPLLSHTRHVRVTYASCTRHVRVIRGRCVRHTQRALLSRAASHLKSRQRAVYTLRVRCVRALL